MFTPVVAWLAHNQSVCWFLAGTVTLLFFGWTLAPLRTSTAAHRERIWLAGLAILALLVAWRWPFLFVPDEINPDEGQLGAGALTLARDPVFWRSIDGSTAGPLDFYALAAIHVGGVPVNFFTIRIVGLLLVWGTLWAAYGTCRLFVSDVAARLALLPFFLFAALATQDDFVHYSTEHVSLCLLAVSTWLLARRQYSADRHELFWWAGGFGLGLLPWAKLQSIPLGAAVAGWFLVAVARDAALTPAQKRRRAGALLLAGMAPSVIALVAIAANGVWADFVCRYLKQNFVYATEHHSFWYVWHGMMDSLNQTWHLELCMAAPLLLVVASCVGRFPRSAFWWAGLILFASAVVAIAVPRRPFAHYLLFGVEALLFWSAAAFGDLARSCPTQRARWILAGGWILFAALLPLVGRINQPVPALLRNLAGPADLRLSSAANVIRACAQRGDTLCVWGWSTGLHVETGLPQATRDGYSYWSIKDSPQRDYYRSRYLSDLQRSRPAVFVDAVGPGSFFFTNRPLEGHEIFPALARFVAENYTQAIDLGQARIYVRNDRATAAVMSPALLRRLAWTGRQTRYENPPDPLPLDRSGLPQNRFFRRNVRMMLPPAEVSWPLQGDEREFDFECGYDPQAWREGAGDGTQFAVWLETAPGTSFPIFCRQLDPVHSDRDRGIVRVRVPLPPFPPGSRLFLRTTAGPAGDNAWDWAFLASASVRRNPLRDYRQFPGFNRVPDRTEATVVGAERESNKLVLMLHAPSRMVYRLTGAERTLAFDYGFRAGAYTGEGRTNGAGFHVELASAGAEATTLWQRELRPLSEAGDRGPQHAAIALPEVRNGDELIVRLDPGAGGDLSWDWTYVADAVLLSR